MRKLLSGVSFFLLVSLSSSGCGADPLPSDKSPGPVAVGKKSLVKQLALRAVLNDENAAWYNQRLCRMVVGSKVGTLWRL